MDQNKLRVQLKNKLWVILYSKILKDPEWNENFMIAIGKFDVKFIII
jgi:hypothetical protein